MKLLALQYIYTHNNLILLKIVATHKVTYTLHVETFLLSPNFSFLRFYYSSMQDSSISRFLNAQRFYCIDYFTLLLTLQPFLGGFAVVLRTHIDCM